MDYVPRAGTFSGETIVVPADDSLLQLDERGLVRLLLRIGGGLVGVRV
jgi:hypothetical protein